MITNIGIVIPVFNEERVIHPLLASIAEQTVPAPVYIVDNGSTDDTLQKIHEFQSTHPRLDLTVIYEPEKGTGTAADTGFRAAIAHGHHVIARTDADCRVSPNWVEAIDRHFSTHPQTQLLGGHSDAIHDHDYRPGDDWQYMAGVRIVFAMRALQARRRGYATPVLGHNMAVRAEAYEHVGGFAHGAIETRDEDIALQQTIVDAYGANSVANDHSVIVATSMRRVRNLGRLETILRHSMPKRRLVHEQKADVR